MNYDNLQIEKKENAVYVKLNRPDVLNSFNKYMAYELQNFLDSASQDDSIRCICITGEGKAFSAGQDLDEAINCEKELQHVVKNHYNPLIKKIRERSKPVVAAVNGTAAGAGANIALACDVVVAAESAKFIQAFSGIGLIPDSGGTYFLPRIIGFQKALSLAILGDKLPAEEAERLGLIYKYFKDDEFQDNVDKIVAKLSKMPTKGIAYTKFAFNKTFNNSLNEQLDLERKLQGKAGDTNDYKEGVDAFLNKRKPEFKGE